MIPRSTRAEGGSDGDGDRSCVRDGDRLGRGRGERGVRGEDLLLLLRGVSPAVCGRAGAVRRLIAWAGQAGSHCLRKLGRRPSRVGLLLAAACGQTRSANGGLLWPIGWVFGSEDDTSRSGIARVAGQPLVGLANSCPMAAIVSANSPISRRSHPGHTSGRQGWIVVAVG